MNLISCTRLNCSTSCFRCPVGYDRKLESFTKWLGFAHPSVHAAKLTIILLGHQFVREQALANAPDTIPVERVNRVLAALAKPPIPELDPSRFDVPESVIGGHNGSIWTDEHPLHLIRITFVNGEWCTLEADSQHAFMLPLKITDSGSSSHETLNPEASQAIADLMPEAYLEKECLAGTCRLLDHDARGTFMVSSTPEPEKEPDPEPPTEPVPPPDPEAFDEIHDVLLRLMRREESAEEKAEAEASGNISQRLRKRLSPEEVRKLIQRGADVNIADDVGQTALMAASWPPFNQLVFRQLAAAGANVEARRNDRCTASWAVCEPANDS
ncbi:MAG: hypothetical protein C0467_28795 [Planctomycetaceae bacterium]|nr:hypothetical protein [Planctomycetaceae bacterium]